jgi:chromosome segregation ATPase
MTRETYRQAYEAARQELLKHLKRREQLEQKIRDLADTLKALRKVCDADAQEIESLVGDDSRMGFTDAIRRQLHIQQRPLSPTEIRDGLVKSGIGRGQSNLLASIHTVLRRMVKAGEIEKTHDQRFSVARRTRSRGRSG